MLTSAQRLKSFALMGVLTCSVHTAARAQRATNLRAAETTEGWANAKTLMNVLLHHRHVRTVVRTFPGDLTALAPRVWY